FKGTPFGFGLDAGILSHGIHQADSFIFANGHISTQYLNTPRFQNWALTLGPTFQFGRNKWSAEAYLRGGILMQNFPQYNRVLQYSDAMGTYQMPIKHTVNDSTNRANAWAGLGGI